jgi:hypothetical protein
MLRRRLAEYPDASWPGVPHLLALTIVFVVVMLPGPGPRVMLMAEHLSAAAQGGQDADT